MVDGTSGTDPNAAVNESIGYSREIAEAQKRWTRFKLFIDALMSMFKTIQQFSNRF